MQAFGFMARKVISMKSLRRVACLSFAAALLAFPVSSPGAAQPGGAARPATEAEHLARVASFERGEAPADPAYLGALVGLSGFYVNQGRYAESLPVLRRAVAASERIHGPEHAVTREVRATLLLAEAFVARPPPTISSSCGTPLDAGSTSPNVGHVDR